MAIIGISCYYHDSAAALVSERGEILAAAQEERFTRKKHDSRFPFCSLDYCLKVASSLNHPIHAYVYYEKPVRVFMRLLETYFNTAPRGFSSFLPAMQSWINEKLFTKQELIKQISLIDESFSEGKLFFSEHHLSHASAAFYPSPFNNAAVLCMDAVGEWATTSAWIGENSRLKPLWEINFPHSLGMLYSSFTYYCGFRVNSGEYKLMGLAPYGEPRYKDVILRNLVEVKDDGSFKLNMKYFKYQRGLRMISSSFVRLFGAPPRNPEEPVNQFYMDIAASIQSATEEIVIKIVKNLKSSTGANNLCLAGGVALNCVVNGRLRDELEFDNIWVQPASGDAGSAVGAAMNYLYTECGLERNKENSNDLDGMSSTYLGPDFSDRQILDYLNHNDIPYEYLPDNEVFAKTAKYLSNGKVVGWFQGRMEYGPRSLGNRSILGDPRIIDMQRTMNLKIKNRESFRPFAPAILEDYMNDYFNLDHESPYMLFTSKLSKKFLTNSESYATKGIDRINEVRSSLPAITHVDNSCRVQTVSKNRNPRFYKLLYEFNKLTNCPVLINTSYNVRGEPIVCTPEDALRCFAYTKIDIVVLGNYIISKSNLRPGFESKFNQPLLIAD